MVDRPRRSARRTPLRLVIACIALLSLVAACGGDDSSSGDDGGSVSTGGASDGDQSGAETPAPRPLSEPATITLAHPIAIEPFASVYVAQATGEFEKENLTVEIVTIPTSDALVQLVQDRVQIQLAGITASALNAAADGADVRYVGHTHGSNPASMDGF